MCQERFGKTLLNYIIVRQLMDVQRDVPIYIVGFSNLSLVLLCRQK